MQIKVFDTSELDEYRGCEVCGSDHCTRCDYEGSEYVDPQDQYWEPR